MIVAEADANGVRTSVLDDSVCNRHAFNDGGGVGGDLLRGEAEAGGEGWGGAKRGGGAAGCVLGALWDVGDTGVFFDGGCGLVARPGPQGTGRGGDRCA